MNNLIKLKNIGPVLAEKLIKAGITSPEILKSTGSENAFIKLKMIDETACFNTLCALEGAIQDVRWHDLSAERKKELNNYFRMIEASLPLSDA
ncbi:MAG: TfoX/Sxy family protein [Calditrichaceae bacterium]|nr:TfoX/Sxy family protein [Calditrichaceae bacterium]MBN2710193.1 TfoX/Sxy family protein [Calditrichaceae bacterium]RQV94167.1 MAG: competence protein TfoX [Calditrichota bacterium]